MKYSVSSYFLILFLLISFFSTGYSQTGGTHIFDFLNLTNSARVAALGGKNISLNDNDLNMPFHNPALLTPEMDNNVVLNYVPYFADISYGYASYAMDMKDIGTFAAGMHYIDYGKFDAADRTGVITGNFYAAEYALNLFYSRSIDSAFRWGVNLKPIYSSLEHYSSSGIATDLGITYTFDDGLSTLAAVARNIGFQFKTYTNNDREPLPFEILLGFTKKLAHAPFRISITAHNLQHYNMRYSLSEELNNFYGIDTTQQNKFNNFADNLFRHFIFGVEFLPSKSFYISASYNYQRRSEMALIDAPGMVGFSFGAGIRLKRFGFSYGHATIHAAGGSDHFSFTVNLSQLYSRN
jgi:hypothetical protein